MWRYRIIIIILIITTVGLLSFWLSRSEKSVTVSPAPILTPGPSQATKKPVFPSGATVTKKPAYKLGVNLKPGGGTMPVFRVASPGDLLVLARRFALSFEKTGNPKTFSSSGKTYYSWSDSVNTFSVSGNPVEIAYQIPLSQGLSSVVGPVDTYGALARSFLASKNLLPHGATLSAPTVAYYAPIGNDPIQTTADRATVVRLDYRLLLEGKPLYLGSPEVPVFSFRFDSSKTLVSFTGYYFGSFQKSGSAGVLPVEKAMNSLYTNGSLVYVSSPEDVNDVRTKKYTPGVIVIKDVSLGYFYETGWPSVTPIYVFTGSSRQGKTNKNLETITFLSAVEGH